MNREPLSPLTDDQRRTFSADGVVLLPGVLDRDWLDLLAGAIDDDIAEPAPGYHGYRSDDGGHFHGNFDNWRHDPRFSRYCLESPLPVIAADLLGCSRVQLFYDQLFVKEPSTPSPTPWHSDQPYWPVAGTQVMSFWVSLDPVTLDSGGMEFIRGSHRWDRWFQPRTFAEGGYEYQRNPRYEEIPDFDSARDDLDLVSYDMAPGDLLAFHALTVHGSGGNQRVDVRRRAYTVRYTGEDVTYERRVGTNPALDRPHHTDGAPLADADYPVAFDVRST